jgi:hypothetical protein
MKRTFLILILAWCAEVALGAPGFNTAIVGHPSQYVGLRELWRMEEASGNRSDVWGGNTLTENGTINSGTGKVGNGADLASTANDFSHTGNQALDVYDTDFTIAFWIKFNAVASRYEVLAANAITDSPFVYLDFAFSSTQLELFAFMAEGDPDSIKGSSISSGVWQFVVLTRNKATGSLRMGIGNADVAAVSFSTYAGRTSPGSQADQAFSIGRVLGAVNSDYVIDEVAIWKRVLSDRECDRLFNCNSGLAYPWRGSDLRPCPEI